MPEPSHPCPSSCRHCSPPDSPRSCPQCPHCPGPTGGKRAHLKLPWHRALGHDSSMSTSSLRISSLSVSDVELNENSLDGKHLVVKSSVAFGDSVVSTHSLIDCGASGFSFVDEEFARQHSLPLTPLSKPRSLEVIDGRPIESGDITHTTTVTFTIGEHREQLPMFVTKLGHYPIVLGIPWLRHHDVAIRFASNLVTFGSPFCLDNSIDRPTTVRGLDHEPPAPHQHTESRTPPPRPSVQDDCIEENSEAPIRSRSRRRTTVRYLDDCVEGFVTGPDVQDDCVEGFLAPSKINMVGAASFVMSAKRDRSQIGSLSLYEINKALDREKLKDTEWKHRIPEEYHDFLPLFDEAVARALPPRRQYDHRIRLQEGFTPPFGPM